MLHNENGKILIFNPQLETISGYSKDEIPDVATWLEKVYLAGIFELSYDSFDR